MKPHWVNTCDRMPELDKEVQVLVIQFNTHMGYACAKMTNKGWKFLTDSISDRVVAWLESERFLNGKEFGDVPTDGIRF